MTSQKKTLSIAVVLALFMTGCATGQQHRADSYTADQVNTAQDVKPVKILAISPAKVQVDNAEAKQKAQLGGAIVGAVLGGVAGNASRKGSSGRITTGATAGAAVGAVAGSMVDDKVLVDGVSIIFKEDAKGKKPKTSTQVGKLCEFKVGDAFMFMTKANETRIQPNNSENCPVEKK